MDEAPITIGEIRKTGHCVAGVRRWFEANGLDFAAMLRDGIAPETMLATNDALGVQVVIEVREARTHG